MNFKRRIRGALNIIHPWYLSAYRMAESGEISIKGNEISIRVDTLYYEFSQIKSIKRVSAGKLNLESWVQIEYIKNSKVKTIYLSDYEDFGIGRMFGNNETLFKALKTFMNK